MKVDLGNYNNSWYKEQIGASGIKQLVWYYINLILFNAYWFPFSNVKIAILKIFGARIGRRLVIKPGVNIKYPWKLNIGNDCWFGEGVWIDNLADVTIGSNVCLSQGALLLTGNHNFSKSTFDLLVQPIILEDGVWIGAKAIVAPGVTCKSHAVLSLHSVATKDLEPFSVYQGNPAVCIRERVINE